MRSYARSLPGGQTRTVKIETEPGMVVETVSRGHGCWPVRHRTAAPRRTARQIAGGLRDSGYTRVRSR